MGSGRTNPASGAQFVQHGYSPWAPTGLLGEAGWPSIASLTCGVVALLLAALGTLGAVAWLSALLGVAFALTLLLPRASAFQRAASGTGLACAVIAVGILVS
jgi:hypothetical protein